VGFINRGIDMFIEIDSNEVLNVSHVSNVRRVGGEIYIKGSNGQDFRIIGFATEAEAITKYNEITEQLKQMRALSRK
jgi:hypothetical protein